ncbi:hypothetical protein AN958_00003 [Leucoagaricus sp. SymC.cos]|nr:hypothetical protein AN958_00003 [Leucoagaricus sp. SymC.cos]
MNKKKSDIVTPSEKGENLRRFDTSCLDWTEEMGVFLGFRIWIWKDGEGKRR